VNPRDGGVNHFLELYASDGEELREHNYLYVPAQKGSLFLEFDLQRTETSTDDVLEVRLGDDQGQGPKQVLARLPLETLDPAFIRRCLPIPNNLRNQAHTLTFEIDAAGGPVDSRVRIDNLAFASKCTNKSTATRTIQFGTASFLAHEASGVAIIEVRLSEPADELVTVEFATADGTAKAGLDYAATRSSLNFSPGTTVLFVSVPVNLDGLGDEPVETVKLTLKGPRTAKLGKLKSATLLISS
jgi:hypothetical protein